MPSLCPKCGWSIPEKRTHLSLDGEVPICGTNPIPTGALLTADPDGFDCGRCETWADAHPEEIALIRLGRGSDE